MKGCQQPVCGAQPLLTQRAEHRAGCKTGAGVLGLGEGTPGRHPCLSLTQRPRLPVEALGLTTLGLAQPRSAFLSSQREARICRFCG